MKILSLCSVLFLLFLLIGCPFQSSVSLTADNEIPVDKQLIGNRYIGRTPDNILTEIYFKEKGNNKFEVEVLRYENEGEIVNKYDLSSTQISKLKFFQITKGENFFLTRYLLAGYTLHIWYLDDDYVKSKNASFSNTNELREFVKNNISDDAAFIGKTSFVKFDASSAKAKEYASFLLVEENKIIKGFQDVYSVKKPDQMLENRNALVKIISDGILHVAHIPRFDGNEELRDATVKLFKVYQAIADAELKELVEIMMKKSVTADMKERKLQLESIMGEKNSNAKYDYNQKLTLFKTKYLFQLP